MRRSEWDNGGAAEAATTKANQGEATGLKGLFPGSSGISF
jgi:hypothetical protein